MFCASAYITSRKSSSAFPSESSCSSTSVENTGKISASGSKAVSASLRSLDKASACVLAPPRLVLNIEVEFGKTETPTHQLARWLGDVKQPPQGGVVRVNGEALE